MKFECFTIQIIDHIFHINHKNHCNNENLEEQKWHNAKKIRKCRVNFSCPAKGSLFVHVMLWCSRVCEHEKREAEFRKLFVFSVFLKVWSKSVFHFRLFSVWSLSRCPRGSPTRSGSHTRLLDCISWFITV